MGCRKLQGPSESITFEEASSMADAKLSELIGFIVSVVDQLDDDKCNEEERDNIKVNMASKLGQLISCSTLKGLLMDPDRYVAELPHNENVKVLED
jgi:hypothetical protein